MIVSHEHRFIFLKTRKTAGTSIELALSRICGPDDIISPVIPADEQLRAGTGRGAQNFESPPLPARAFNHAPARRVRRIVGHPAWRSYYKFSIERDPWDATVSLYYWITRDTPDPISFADFVRSPRVTGLAEANYRTYRIDGRVAVDRMCRFEALRTDLDAVWDRLGLPGRPELPRTKSGSRPARTDHRALYTPQTAAIVADAFAASISDFGFTFAADAGAGDTPS